MTHRFKHRLRRARRRSRVAAGRLRIFRRGFTLVELVVAVAVLGILAAILLSVISKSRASSHRAQCDTHLKAIALALDAFKQEQGSYPEVLQELVDRKYITDPSLMVCPDDPRPNPSYNDFYAIRGPHSSTELPVLVCPFHEDYNRGLQAYVGRYTTQFATSPAQLKAGASVTVEHPGKNPVAAPVGLTLHGADRLRTGPQGSATIRFADGSEAEMGRDADLTILQSFISSKASGKLYTLVHQSIGRVIYTVNHGTNGTKFDVVTPTATAGALGTSFEIRVDPKQGTWLMVYEGKVRFNTLSGTDDTASSSGSNPPPNGEWRSSPAPQPPPPPPPAPRRPPPPPPNHPPGPPPPP